MSISLLLLVLAKSWATPPEGHGRESPPGEPLRFETFLTPLSVRRMTVIRSLQTS